MISAKPRPRRQPELPTDRAFLVQFRRGAKLDRRSVAGRVEHVVSGETAHFHSFTELVSFVRRVVGRLEHPEGGRQ